MDTSTYYVDSIGTKCLFTVSLNFVFIEQLLYILSRLMFNQLLQACAYVDGAGFLQPGHALLDLKAVW